MTRVTVVGSVGVAATLKVLEQVACSAVEEYMTVADTLPPIRR
jgi:hypothetical protein